MLEVGLAIGALGAALVIALVTLVVQHYSHKRELDLVLAQETRALDRARAAEIRSEQQIDAMLARISTEPRLALSEDKPSQVTEGLKFIPDTPEADDVWNEFRGVAEDDDEVTPE